MKEAEKEKEVIKVKDEAGEHHEVRLLAIPELRCVRLLFRLSLNKE